MRDPQRGIPLETARAFIAQVLALTGLRAEGPWAPVPVRLDSLRHLQLSPKVLAAEGAIVFAGEALAGAPLLQAVTQALPAPKPIPYAFVFTLEEARGLVDAGLSPTQIIRMVAEGTAPDPERPAYVALGVIKEFRATRGVTSEAAFQQASEWLRQANIDHAFFEGRHVAALITTQGEAQRFLQSHLQHPDGRPLDLTTLQAAYNALQRYL